MTLRMTSAQVVETSVNVTNNSPSRDYSHPDDQTTQTTLLVSPFNPYHRYQKTNFPLLPSSIFQSATKEKLLLSKHVKHIPMDAIKPTRNNYSGYYQRKPESRFTFSIYQSIDNVANRTTRRSLKSHRL